MAAGRTDDLAAGAPALAARLVTELRQGDRRAIGRAISEVENATATGGEIVRLIRPHIGRAHVIGITGPPGAGKSTLVSALIGELCARGRTIGVVAVDPSSPVSGGAVLGDRVRMDRHSTAAGVFIRSLAARGHPGGLSRTTGRVVEVLDAAGFDAIVVETVGAGQSEVEIADIADTRVVVCPPGLGDDIQAIKAGILEIADIFVVSKADLPLADKTERDLLFMLDLRLGAAPPVMRVVAIKGEGVAALADAIDAHACADGRRRERRGCARMRRVLAAAVGNAVRERVQAATDPALDRICDALVEGELDEAAAIAQAFAWLDALSARRRDA